METLIYEITYITVVLDILQFTDTKSFILLEILNLVHHLTEHLWGVLWRIAILDETNLEGGKKASINEKKASGQELRDYFTKVLPEWDQERVQNSHIKKLITWYNILVEAGITDFKDADEAPAAEESK